MTSAREIRTGIVLAGGESTRIGRPKPLIRIGAETMLARVAKTLDQVCSDMILVVKEDQDDGVPDLGLALDMKVVTDRYTDAGPMAGLEAGLSAAAGEYAFVTGSDHPFLSPQLIEAMFEGCAGCAAAVPQLEGGLEPFHAVYSTVWLPVFREALEESRASLNRLLQEALQSHSLAVRVFKREEIEALDPELDSLFDIDTRARLQQARRKLRIRSQVT